MPILCVFVWQITLEIILGYNWTVTFHDGDLSSLRWAVQSISWIKHFLQEPIVNAVVRTYAESIVVSIAFEVALTASI
jgi:hypothetical protein